MKARLIAPLALSFLALATEGKPDEEGFWELVEPLIENYCMDCHDEESSRNLSLEGIKGNLVDGPDLDRWEKVLHQFELWPNAAQEKPNHHRRLQSRSMDPGIPKGWAQTGKQVASVGAATT